MPWYRSGRRGQLVLFRVAQDPSTARETQRERPHMVAAQNPLSLTIVCATTNRVLWIASSPNGALGQGAGARVVPVSNCDIVAVQPRVCTAAIRAERCRRAGSATRTVVR